MMRLISLLLTVCLLPCGAVFSQVPDRAEIRGRVVDASNAALREVRLTIRNESTGYESSTVSSATGDFSFPFVSIGSYMLTADLPGFQKLRIGGLRVASNQRLDLPITLQVGGLTTELTVTGEPNRIETSTAAMTEIFSEAQIKDIPLILGPGVRAAQSILLGLTPGSSFYDPLGTGGVFAAPTISMSVNGSPVGGVAFSLNGIDNTAFGAGTVGALTDGPNPDAVGEFSVVTHFSAESGTEPVLVQIETKTGSNTLHGQARAFHVDPTTNARDFFDLIRKSTYRTDAVGFQFSGPLVLPPIYDGHNKTLFFVDSEFTRSRQSYNALPTVFSDKERLGDFTDLPQSRWPIDPATRQPFPGGKIPAERILPLSRSYIDQMIPKATSGTDYDYGYTTRPATRQSTARVDHKFSSRDTLQLSLFQNKVGYDEPEGATQTLWKYQQWSNSASLREVHGFSARSFNSFAFGRSFSRFNVREDGRVQNSPGNLGFNITSTVYGYPEVWLPSVQDFYSGGGKSLKQLSLWTIKDDFATVKGRHSLKTGAALRIHRGYTMNDRSINSSNLWAQFSGTNPYGTGNDIGDFLLGLPSEYFQKAATSVSPRRILSGFYFQDDVKLHAQLTLNLGLRYELNSTWSTADGHMSTFRPGAQSKMFPAAPAGLLFPGDIDPSTGTALSKSFDSPDRNNLAPRIGIAFSPSVAHGLFSRLIGRGSQTAIRGGYGVFYMASRATAYNSFNVPPWSMTVDLGAKQLADSGATFANPWGLNSDPFSTSLSGRSFAEPIAGVVYVEPQAREPYEQQWDFAISRQLQSNLNLSIAYAGNSALHLYRQYQANPALLTPTAAVGNEQSRRIYSDFSTVWALASDGRSSYHSLQVGLNRRFTSRFQFNASYVFSKALDNASPGSRAVNDFADRDLTPWGRANFDRRHQFIMLGVLELPKVSRPYVGNILSKWQLTSIAQMRSGLPLNIRNGFDSTLRGGGPLVLPDAEITGPFRQLNPREVHTFTLPNGSTVTGHFMFDPTVFTVLKPTNPQQARAGNLGRNVFTGPGINDVDLSLMKRIDLGEKQNVALRIDFTNLFNHAQFVEKGADAVVTSSATFGMTDRTMGGRHIQFVLKYNF
jgi:Carboxypeptidase regulatory-like domain